MATNPDLVTHLFRDLLGREADPDGLTSWVGLLDAGTPFADVRTGIAASNEALGDIAGLYRAVLWRDGEAQGLANWQAALSASLTLAQVRIAMAASDEARADIAGLYYRLLGREAEAQGLSGWQALLGGPLSLAQVRGGIAASDEARGQIESFYRTLLGRDAEAAGLAGWQALLGGTLSLDQVRAGIAGSDEARAHGVDVSLIALYNDVFGFDPKPATLGGLKAVLTGGATMADVETDLRHLAKAQRSMGDESGWTFGDRTYWLSTGVIITIAFPPPTSPPFPGDVLTVQVSSYAVGEPKLAIYVDGEEVPPPDGYSGHWFVESGAPRTITVTGDWGAGPHDIRIEHTGFVTYTGTDSPITVLSVDYDGQSVSATPFTLSFFGDNTDATLHQAASPEVAVWEAFRTQFGFAPKAETVAGLVARMSGGKTIADIRADLDHLYRAQQSVASDLDLYAVGDRSNADGVDFGIHFMPAQVLADPGTGPDTLVVRISAATLLDTPKFLLAMDDGYPASNYRTWVFQPSETEGGIATFTWHGDWGAGAHTLTFEHYGFWQAYNGHDDALTLVGASYDGIDIPTGGATVSFFGETNSVTLAIPTHG